MSCRKTILITRPQEQAIALKNRLELDALECNILIGPVLQISHGHDETFNPIKKDFNALLITSSNALPVTIKLPFFDFTIPVLCVGKVTAEKAKKSGFRDIRYVAENASELFDFIAKHYDQYPSILYLRGKNISFDFKSRLKDLGIHCDEFVAYDALQVTDYPREIISKIMNGEIHLVTFFSKRSAENFISILNKLKIFADDHALKQTKALCISSSVIKSLSGYFEGNTFVARTPDEIGMIEAIRSIIDET